MDEPTDRALSLQGMKRAEYDSLSPEGKAVIASRSRRLTELSNISVAADLLIALSESDDDSRRYVTEALEGRHPDFEDSIRGVIREYLDANVETGIKDYFRIKYGKDGISAIISPAPAVQTQAPEPAEAQKPAPQAPAPEPEAPASESADVPEPQATAPTDSPQPPQEAAGEEAPKPPPETGPVSRDRAIAMMIGRTDKRDVDKILRHDADIIKNVMSITDENSDSGMTDERIFKACQALISDKRSGIQYLSEALIKPNRDRLLTIAKAIQ